MSINIFCFLFIRFLLYGKNPQHRILITNIALPEKKSFILSNIQLDFFKNIAILYRQPDHLHESSNFFEKILNEDLQF